MHRPAHRHLLLRLAAGTALSPLALAQDPGAPVNPFEEPDESALFAMDEQLVTVASRYAQTVAKAPNIIAVVDSDQIAERGYRTVSDILRALPGIYLWKSEEGRDLASFRGIVSADNNKILLLVDGVPWYDGVYTHAFIDDFLPVAHIRQVEVIKGPGSAVYGTGAFAGVVNIVTRSATDLDGAFVRWTVGGGARSDLSAAAGGRARVSRTDVSFSAYARHFSQSGDGVDITPRGRRDILGEDPKRGMAAGARLEVAGLELQLHHVDYRHAFLTSEADDPFDVLGRDIDGFGLFYHYTTLHARYRAEVADGVTITPHAWSHRYDNPGSYFFLDGWDTVEVADGVFETTPRFTTVETQKDTRRMGGQVDVEARPGIDHVTVAGAGTELTRIVPGPNGGPGVIDREFTDLGHAGASTGFQASGSLLNLYAYAQHTWTALPAVELVAGARYDQRVPVNPEDDPRAGVFQPTATPRAGVLIVPDEDLTVKVLYGRAFRAPNVRELLVSATETDDSGAFVFASGNLDVRPESIDTVETEVRGEPVDGLDLRGSASWSLVSREIDKVNPPNEYQNLDGRLQVVGLEAEAQYSAGPIDASAAYALTLARYGARGPYAGRAQFEFPPHMAKAALTARLGDRLSATALAELYSSRPRADWGPTVGLTDGVPYGLIHLSGRMDELGPDGRVAVGFAVRNATNTRYSTPMYRDEVDRGTADAPRFVYGIEGESRMFNVTVDVRL